MPGQNLVVCPLSVLYNWSEQLKLHAPSLKVRTYHGADRDLPWKIRRIQIGMMTFWNQNTEILGAISLGISDDLFFRPDSLERRLLLALI